MPSPYEESILTALRRISRSIDLYSRRLAKQSGLTVPQLVCLRYLAAHGAAAPTAIARSITLSSGTVTGILDRLVRRGLVTRRRLETDRRRVEVALTEEGQRICAAAPSPLHERLAGRLERLPEQQQESINTTLHRIVEMMEAEELDTTPAPSSGPQPLLDL